MVAALFGAALFIASLSARTASAADPIVGTWKLVSITVEDLDTKEKTMPYGQKPGGSEIFTPEGRYIFLVTAEGRQATKTEKDRAAAFVTMFAQAGKYRVEGTQYILTVELAKEPAVVGAKVPYDITIEGARRTSIGMPLRNPGTGHMTRATLVWEREGK
jgi:hypothetical protein